MISNNPERDWVEDFTHENGNYNCICLTCGNYFTGHKRRVECKICARVMTNRLSEQQPEGETPIIKRLENLESVVANLTSLVNELAIAVRKRLEKPTT